MAEIADTAVFPNNEYIPHAMPAIAIRTLAVMLRVKFSLGQSKYISPENAIIAPILLFLGIFGLVKNDDESHWPKGDLPAFGPPYRRHQGSRFLSWLVLSMLEQFQIQARMVRICATHMLNQMFKAISDMLRDR